MHPWSPLNDRQLALLTRIGDGSDPVTSDSPELAVTARALKGRGLIVMPKRGGKWHAEITDAGRFYLEHGHHPDRPEPVQRKQRSAHPEQRTRPTSAAEASRSRVRDEARATARREASTAVTGGGRSCLDRRGAAGRAVSSHPEPQ